MEDLKSKNLSFKKVMLITIFITLFQLLGGPLHYYTFLSSIPHEINGITVWENIWKIIWASLAFVSMNYYNHELPISISEMFNFRKINFKFVIIVLSIVILMDLSYSIVIYKNISIPADFNFIKSTINFFFVGLTEELIFRGWAMNAFSKVTSIRNANIIQSVFFMLSHLLPYCLMLLMGWGTITDVPLSYLAMQLPYCIVIGCVYGRIVNKTHSLWTTVIMHCFGDVIATMLHM